jgi:hypothetical protein
VFSLFKPAKGWVINIIAFLYFFLNYNILFVKSPKWIMW